jgi:uncharacterized protein
MQKHMYRTDDVIAALRAMREDLKPLGVRHVSVFGSVARGEAGVNSDIDLALDVDPAAIPDGFAFIGYVEDLKRLLAKRLGTDVDVVLLPAERPQLQETLRREAIPAY